MVGEVVNVISEFAKDTTRNFMDDIKKPALRLIATYLIQVMEVIGVAPITHLHMSVIKKITTFKGVHPMWYTLRNCS